MLSVSYFLSSYCVSDMCFLSKMTAIIFHLWVTLVMSVMCFPSWQSLWIKQSSNLFSLLKTSAPSPGTDRSSTFWPLSTQVGKRLCGTWGKTSPLLRSATTATGFVTGINVANHQSVSVLFQHKCIFFCPKCRRREFDDHLTCDWIVDALFRNALAPWCGHSARVGLWRWPTTCHPDVGPPFCHIASESVWEPYKVIFFFKQWQLPSLFTEFCQTNQVFLSAYVTRRGILSISWSQADSELLLSSAKDNRILCWNPNTGEVKSVKCSFLIIYDTLTYLLALSSF